MRFCKREDIEADIWNSVREVEDFRSSHPKMGSDIFLIAKRWLADREVLRLIALVPADTAAKIRRGLHLPDGVAARRAISPKVRANIERYVPRCQMHGELSPAAAAYLTEWSTGKLKMINRPERYEIFSHRWQPEERLEDFQPGTWTIPRRKRHIDLTIEAEADAASSDSEVEGDIDLPPVLLDDCA